MPNKFTLIPYRSGFGATPEPSVSGLWNDFRDTNSEIIWAPWNSAPRGFKLGQTYDSVSTFMGGVKNLAETSMADMAVNGRSPFVQYAAIGMIGVVDAFGPATAAEILPVGKFGKVLRAEEQLGSRLVTDRAAARPGGYIANDVDAHGLLSPQVNRAEGYANTQATIMFNRTTQYRINGRKKMLLGMIQIRPQLSCLSLRQGCRTQKYLRPNGLFVEK